MKNAPITLTLHGPAEHLSGFKFWWLKYVADVRLDVHCARCLVGHYERRVHKQMRLNTPVELTGDLINRDLVYLCGVSPRWQTNFHAAVHRKPGSFCEVETYNGITARFENAERISITPLEPGYKGLGRDFTTCRNYQFAVQVAAQRQI